VVLFFKELATLGAINTLGLRGPRVSVHETGRRRFAQAGKAWRWLPRRCGAARVDEWTDGEVAHPPRRRWQARGGA